MSDIGTTQNQQGPAGPPGTPGSVSITGTGFAHVTSSSIDAAARAVGLTTADVSGVLPVANGGTGIATGGSAGQVAQWLGGVFAWAALNLSTAGLAGVLPAAQAPGFSLTSDVTATAAGGAITAAATVVALQGFGVATTTPTNNQVLTWNAGTSKWTPTAAGASVVLAGDAVGASSANTVIASHVATAAFFSSYTNSVLTSQIGVVGGNSGIWLSSLTPSATNVALASDGVSNTIVNVPTGGAVNLAINGVNQLSAAAAAITLSNTLLQFPTSIGAPTIKQGDGSGGQSLTVQAQNNTSATGTGGSLLLTAGNGLGATATTSGNVVAALFAPGGASTTEAQFQVQRSGVVKAALGPLPGVPADGALWLGVAIPSGTNVCLYSNGSLVAVTAPSTSGNIVFGDAVKTYAQFSPGVFLFGGTSGVGVASNATMQFDGAATSPTISQASTSSATTQALTIATQASTAGATANGAALVISLSAPGASGARAFVQIQEGVTNYVQLGRWFTGSTYGSAYFGNVTPNGSNFAFLGDGSTTTQLNSGSTTGGVYLSHANVTFGLSSVGQSGGASVQLFSSTPSFGGGVGMLGVKDRITAPSSNPAGGGILYSEAGAGKWRGSSGTTTTFGPADLEGFRAANGNGHCPTCGTDFAHEWHNERYGSLTVCMRCLTDEIGERPWIVRRAA